MNNRPFWTNSLRLVAIFVAVLWYLFPWVTHWEVVIIILLILADYFKAP